MNSFFFNYLGRGNDLKVQQSSVSESASRKLPNLRKVINVIRKLHNLPRSVILVIFVKYAIYSKLNVFHSMKRISFHRNAGRMFDQKMTTRNGNQETSDTNGNHQYVQLRVRDENTVWTNIFKKYFFDYGFCMCWETSLTSITGTRRLVQKEHHVCTTKN